MQGEELFNFLYLAQTWDELVQSSGWVMYQHCEDYCIRDPHFTCEEVEVQRGFQICQKPHSYPEAEFKSAGSRVYT